MSRQTPENHGIAIVLEDLKNEFLEMVDTRLSMLKAEILEKMKIWQAALPLLAGAVAFLSAGFAAMTFGLIAWIRAAFLPGPYGWAISGFIVGFLYVALGVGGLAMKWRIFRPESIMPERTLKILKQDQRWLEKEVA